MDIAFEIAAGSVDITPETPLPLARFYDPHKPAAIRDDRLEANALVMRRSERLCVFLSYDLIYVSAELREAVASELAGLVASEDLFVNASHTHFAPPTDRHLPGMGPVSDAYMMRLAKLGAGLVKGLLAQPAQPAALHYSEAGASDHSINRRLKVFGLGRSIPPLRTRWEMRPNPLGSYDDIVRMILVRGADGAVKAICWEYSCHPVCFPHTDRISTDYPGVVRRALRAVYGPVPVIFWQGFSGDVRPRTVRPSSRGRFGFTQPPAFQNFDDAGWGKWSNGLAERVVEISRMAARTVTGDIRSKRWRVRLRELGPDSGGRDLTIQEVAVGDSLHIFGISAEVSSGYVRELAQARARATVIPVGCIDGVPGYLPTSEMVPQGGYEAKGFMKLFRVRGRYRRDVSDRVRRLIFDNGLTQA
jgi:hypothetical protein